MAACLNCTPPMVTTNNSNENSSNLKIGNNSLKYKKTSALIPDIRTMYVNANKSPLRVFVSAKKKINDIYVEIDEYVHETIELINILHAEREIVSKTERELFESYIPKVAGIREVLARDHMKVAFFGRTSNGKSSVINAMLREKILPNGIGHTTNCFCQVEGCDGSEAYLIKEGSDEKLNVKDIKQLANALSQEKLSENSLIRIFWPRDRCSLLRDGVVFMDSPGVDVSANLDDWIDNHCLNADVFVLVLNAESTMTRAEKQFFHKVSQKLSKPNIFILNNRWDASANEQEFQESVKSQHTERCVDFLTKELKITNEEEAAERVFFVSAREVVQARIEKAKGNSPSSGAIAEGFQIRYFEFQDFERKFEECISKSAVETKFKKHSFRGKALSSDMCSMLDSIIERISTSRNLKLDQKNCLTEYIKGKEIGMMDITRGMVLEMDKIVEEVEKNVSRILNEEILNLSVLVDEFNMPFYPEPIVLNVYKKELNSYVESGLESNLRARLSTALDMNLESVRREMTESMHALVPNEKFNEQTKQIVVRTQPFEMLYTLNCQNLCADFQEDLKFKFSWGITTMLKRFTNKAKGRNRKNSAIMNRQSSLQVASPIMPINAEPVCLIPTSIGDIAQEYLSMISRLTWNSIRSQGNVGGVIVVGIMLKAIGWRLVVGVGALYGCVYMYERLSWSNSAKERVFKAQYVRHASRKFKMIVDLISANCSHQVQQELSSTFSRLCRSVDCATTDMKEDLKAVEEQLDALENDQKKLKLLRNKANYIKNELEIFENDYIKSN
uniref:Dynamin-type G domain-containing protein n=1 Tax=Glossina brevipalpis TaxID=37001 RepID=A0A1A9X2I7_9MUSC